MFDAYCALFFFIIFFFFQAEDGIRDADVTGVQTCALPIFSTQTAFNVFSGKMFFLDSLFATTFYQDNEVKKNKKSTAINGTTKSINDIFSFLDRKSVV